jgi:outer membrane protein
VADATIEQQRQLLLDAQDTILLNVAQGYYQVLRSERQVQVLISTLELQQARVDDVTARVKNGLSRRMDLAQSVADADATRVALVQAQSDVRNGRAVLAFLIGVKSVDGPLDDSFAVPPDPGAEMLFEQQALANRQDFLAAHAAVVAARNAVETFVAEYYPSVQLNVAGFLYRENFSDSTKWDAILSANLPIFSAGLIEADVRSAWSRLRQAALAESLLERQVRQDVQVAYENLATSERRITELHGEVDASSQAFQQSRDAYVNGLARNLDVLASQDLLLSAELQLASAAFDRTVFYLDLVRATGRLTTRTPGEGAAAATTLPADRVAQKVAPVRFHPASTLPATQP